MSKKSKHYTKHYTHFLLLFWNQQMQTYVTSLQKHLYKQFTVSLNVNRIGFCISFATQSVRNLINHGFKCRPKVIAFIVHIKNRARTTTSSSLSSSVVVKSYGAKF